MNYKQAKNLYSTARNKDTGKPLQNNTRLVKTTAGYGIKLHDTIVVNILPGNRWVLDSGEWRTYTTKDRINKYAPGYVRQENFIWSINGSRFYDGMIINSKGRAIKPRNNDGFEKKHKAMNKIIHKYAELYADKINNGTLPEPDSGDCWFCSMRTVEDRIPLGDKTKDNTHLQNHIEEGYIVPSLAVNALIEAGYKQPGWFWYMKQGDSVKRAVVKYIQKRLLPKN